MNLYIIKHKTHQHDYYRFLVPSRSGNHYMDGTQVKERAAVFLDSAAAQEVCDSLYTLGFKEYEVVPFETAI
jgi:hypothetical protein